MTLADEYLNVHTPENVAFGYEVAGIGSRFLAALVDTIIILLLQGVVLIVTAVVADVPALGSWFTVISGIIAIAFLWGYYIFFEMVWNGQSPGKRLVKLRVIRNDGTPLTLTESLIRNLIRLVDLLPGTYGIGVVTMFIDRQSRRLGDIAAGVLVVHDQASVTLQSLSQSGSPVPRQTFRLLPGEMKAGESIANLPVERLTEEDLYVAEAFLKRYEELTNNGLLGRQIVKRLCRQMEIPPPTLGDREVAVWITHLVEVCSRRPSSS